MQAKAAGAIAPFAALLRTLRERAGLTQEELAERAGLTSHGVSALERGTRTRPYPHTVRGLAEALGASAAERASLIAAVPARGGSRRAGALPALQRGLGGSRPARLVPPPTPMRGRESDVAAVVDLVRSGRYRLVTMTGPGGVGKTRLLAAVCEALADDYPDGVAYVALAPLVDPAAVTLTMGRALGLVVSDGPDALNVITDHLRPLRLLLALDNFEHLLVA